MGRHSHTAPEDPSPSGERFGYHGPYYPRPGTPYPMVGCEVLSGGETNSAVPLPGGQRWWHDYNSNIPPQLVDVSKHSIVLYRTDLEGWLQPGTIEVLPLPTEFITDTEARAPFRVEYADWLATEQTAGSSAWLVDHPQGLPYIPPPTEQAPANWVQYLPPHLRDFSRGQVITHGTDGAHWVKPGTVDLPSLRDATAGSEDAQLRDEFIQWMEEHLTWGFGVATAHQQLERRCGEESDGTYKGEVINMIRPSIPSRPSNVSSPSPPSSSPESSSDPSHFERLRASLDRLSAVESTLLAAVLLVSGLILLRSVFLVLRRLTRSRRTTRSSYPTKTDPLLTQDKVTSV